MLLLAVGCRELPAYFKGGAPLAKVGHRTLYLHEVERLAPAGIAGDDSAAFYRMYADRWVARQLKLGEAERIFSEAELADVEAMVEEYRQSLLIRKLERHYVDIRIDTAFTEESVQAYYNAHLEDFKSDRTLVKGRILRLPDGERQTRKLLGLMRSPSPESRKDLEDICTKQNFLFEDLASEWVDWDDFLSRLPALRDHDYSSCWRRATSSRCATTTRTTISSSSPSAVPARRCRWSGSARPFAASSSTSGRAN